MDYQQFQTIYNNINSLNNSTTTSLSTSLSTSSPTSNDDTEEYISNKIKFNSSIKIITESNKRILKKQHNNIGTTTAMKSISLSDSYKKDIKSCTCGGSGGGSGNRDMEIIFYIVWRNIVIRNEILFHSRLSDLKHFENELDVNVLPDSLLNLRIGELLKHQINYHHQLHH